MVRSSILTVLVGGVCVECFANDVRDVDCSGLGASGTS